MTFELLSCVAFGACQSVTYLLSNFISVKLLLERDHLVDLQPEAPHISRYLVADLL
jgi:hypothetical protein